MSKDGYILEQLTKQRSEYKLNGCKITSNVQMRFDNIDYTKYVKIRRMVKRMKCGVLMLPEGDLDTINLIGNPKQRIVEYLIITGFVWGMYLAWLIPFMLYWVQVEWDEFVNWLITGTVFEMVFTYPIAKMSIRYGPKITKWVKSNI